MTIAVITGTRRDTRQGAVSRWLDSIKPRIVIMGDAEGVDYEGRMWCLANGAVPVVCFAPWKLLGNPAGPKRNDVIAEVAQALAEMLSTPGEDVVCAAFPDEKSRGTWDCSRKLYRAGFEVATPEWNGAKP